MSVRTIVHLSDLHFGRVDPARVGPLVAAIHALGPDLVAVSGDLTQRARREEFRAARTFLDGLRTRTLAVPGNHDVPLWDVWSRFRAPLERWRRYVSPDPEPFFSDGALAVCGVNTARSLTFTRGRINARQIARLEERFRAVPASAVKIVVSHHALDLPARFAAHGLAGRARDAAGVLSRCGVDLLLAGHLHATHAETGSSASYRIGGHAAVVVQAGTALSTRVRGEENSFNVVRVDDAEILLERHRWCESSGRFEPSRLGVVRRSRTGNGPRPS